MASNARNALAPGTRFGRYEVITDIASGGMAMVYLARALGAAGFQRLVAIKLMHAQYANDEEFVGMFMDEARLAARIRHPNVVATLDLENDEDGLYLVMEYVEGGSLLSLLRAASRAGKRIPPTIVVRIVLDALSGLHAAHELTGDTGEPLRLVHRDVSPHNVLVGIDGISRITDFGVASAGERLSTTRDGQLKGKLAYMAPEQTTSTAIDRRVDLFAMGVVLWECLAGKRLMSGLSDAEVLRNLLVTPIPSLREVVPEVPEALEQVCMKALSRDRDLRFALASEMAEALEQAAGTMGIASTRTVSEYVGECIGKQISSMQEQVRGSIAIDPGANTPSLLVRRREKTDPARIAEARDAASPIPLAVRSNHTPGRVVAPRFPRSITLPDITPKRSGHGVGLVAALLLALLAVSGSAFEDSERAQRATALALSPPDDAMASTGATPESESTETDAAPVEEAPRSDVDPVVHARSGSTSPGSFTDADGRTAPRRPPAPAARVRAPVRPRAPFNPESM